MGKLQREVYHPDPASAAVYDKLYAEYVRLHDYFGRGGNDSMHRLRALRDQVLGSGAHDPDLGDTTSGSLDDETGGNG